MMENFNAVLKKKGEFKLAHKEELKYEDAIVKLENIVESLERNQLPLESAVKLFQEGIELSKYCSDMLDDIERKISVILQDSDSNITEKCFDAQNYQED